MRLKLNCVPPVFSTDKQDSLSFEGESCEACPPDTTAIIYPASAQHSAPFAFPTSSPPFGSAVGLARLGNVNPPNPDFFMPAAQAASSNSSPYVANPFLPSASPELPLSVSAPPPYEGQSPATSTGWRSEKSDADLAEQLGDLKISGIGSGQSPCSLASVVVKC